MIHISHIKETCVYISDIEQTKSFYHGLLQLPVIAEVEGRHIFFQAGESVLLCFVAEKTLKEEVLPPHGATGSIHFAFEVPAHEYAKAIKEIRSAGIEILHEQEWKNELKSFYFHDPDKNLIEIIEEGLWD